MVAVESIGNGGCARDDIASRLYRVVDLQYPLRLSVQYVQYMDTAHLLHIEIARPCCTATHALGYPPLPPHPATAPAFAPTALNPSFACSKYPSAAPTLAGELLLLASRPSRPSAAAAEDVWAPDEGGRARSRGRATAVRGVVVVVGIGGGDRAGRGGDGAKSSLGGGGEIRICENVRGVPENS
jgi:hypothetical protein